MEYSAITKIKKRDGRIVNFDKKKIAEAIFKAASSVGGKDRASAEELASRVVAVLDYQHDGKSIPTVEAIQDIVERVLIKAGHVKTAKAYILYRQQQKKIREMKSAVLDAQNIINEYLNQAHWNVNENSNEAYSFSGLMLHTAGKVISTYTLTEIYPEYVSAAHKDGRIHIHDLTHGFIGYCAGWSLKNLLLMGFGGIQNKVDAKPAKHLDVAISQMVNYMGCLQMEFAGAQAFSSVDTLLAPFVRADNMSYDDVKQTMQKLVFSLNIPSRWGCFSEDTEILTESGWKKGTELNVGEVIATFNTKTEEIEYLPVSRMTKDRYKGKMINLKNRITDQLVTPNHRVIRKIHNYDENVSESKYVFEEAAQLNTKMPLIPLGGKFMGCEANENLVKLLSWIVSEGSLCKKERIVIHQSQEMSPENCNEIRGILENLNIPYDEKAKYSGFTGKKNCLTFRLNRPTSNSIYKQFFPDFRKTIPQSLGNISTPLARSFIDTYMKADGWAPENKIYTKKKEDADTIQEMIAKAGWGSTLSLNKNGIYVVRVIKHEHTQVNTIEEVDYDGVVWCPTTANGTVVARRNGKVFVSGNSQYPFTNLTFDWVVPEDMAKEKAIVGGKLLDTTYSEYQEEVDMINRAFLEVMLEGDANGRIFTFPIPTYNITREFDWNSPNANLLFDVTSKYGTPYFQNYVGSNLDPSSIRAMCCRLNINQKEIMKRPGSMWGPGDSTGSIGVVTINMNRIGYGAESEEDFFEKLRYLMGLARDSLEIKRRIIQKNLDNGLMPYTKRYLGTWKNHFSTVGLCGMNECCMNFLKKDISTPEGTAFTIKALGFMRDVLQEFQHETGNLYNLEATPAESTSYRFARLDKEAHPDIITSGKDAPFLTNSTNLPVDHTDDIVLALQHQNEIQPLYTGGTIFHTFLGERLSDGEATKALVKKIAHNTRLPYFSITPTFSVCNTHGYLKGEHSACPECGKNTEVYSRVVGYFRPVKNWNAGKQEEFRFRKEYLEEKALSDVPHVASSKPAKPEEIPVGA